MSPYILVVTSSCKIAWGHHFPRRNKLPKKRTTVQSRSAMIDACVDSVSEGITQKRTSDTAAEVRAPHGVVAAVASPAACTSRCMHKHPHTGSNCAWPRMLGKNTIRTRVRFQYACLFRNIEFRPRLVLCDF